MPKLTIIYYSHGTTASRIRCEDTFEILEAFQFERLVQAVEVINLHLPDTIELINGDET